MHDTLLRKPLPTLSETLAASGALSGVLVGSANVNKSTTSATIANSLWVEKKYCVAPAFQELLQRHFGAQSGSIAEDDLSPINGWINEQTHGMSRMWCPSLSHALPLPW